MQSAGVLHTLGHPEGRTVPPELRTQIPGVPGPSLKYHFPDQRFSFDCAEDGQKAPAGGTGQSRCWLRVAGVSRHFSTLLGQHFTPASAGPSPGSTASTVRRPPHPVCHSRPLCWGPQTVLKTRVQIRPATPLPMWLFLQRALPTPPTAHLGSIRHLDRGL